MSTFQKKLWLGLFVMVLLTPLGIFLPEHFQGGDAWGEWGADTLGEMLGYVPAGLERLADIWRAPLPDYTFGGDGGAMVTQVIAYIVSGLFGALLVGISVYLIYRMTIKN